MGCPPSSIGASQDKEIVVAVLSVNVTLLGGSGTLAGVTVTVPDQSLVPSVVT